ncbi:MAG: PKD domain-containing protein [Bacteroidia bacterium]
MITINSTVPSQLTVCSEAKTFTISIYNPSPFLLTNDTLKLTLPVGIEYQQGTITGTGVSELNISAPSQPTFLLPSIPTLTYLNISFKAAATCNVLAFLSGGGIPENKVRVNYTANSNFTFDQHTTSSYIVRQPNISISNFTNQSYVGAIGDTYNRCVTVTNGGFGELHQFTLTDNHGSGLDVTAVSIGSWLTNGNNETITLTGANFTTIGDGDTLFENGESIVICETVNILNCISVGSAFEAYWGCNTQNCQSSISNANVVFPNLIPNLVFSPTPSMNTCMGNGDASAQQLRIINNGLGNAVNVQLDIFQTGGAGSGYQANLGSNIDTASFTIKNGIAGTFTHFSPTTSYATAPLNCMTNPQGRVLINIPLVEAGDTIYLKWNTYTCCYNACTNTGDYDINGWRYKGSYENICQSSYVVPEAWGRQYSRMRVAVNNNGSPSTLTNGQTGTFNFLFSIYENNFPAGPGAHWRFEVTLPPCIVYDPGTFLITRSNGTQTWAPSSVSVTGNVLTAIYSSTPPWSLLQAQLTFNATVDCSACGGGSSGTVTVQPSYIPNNTCACSIVPSCQTTSLSVICPSPCPEGMVFRYFEMKRTSYGLPDNEPGGGNGVPDVGGTLDFTKIKTDRALFGDTITCSFNGIVKTSLAYPSWQYCYAYSSISNGNRLTYIDASLTIYRGGVAIVNCNTFTPTVTNSGSTRRFNYNLSLTALGACANGYIYSNNDSVVFKPRYRVTSNIGNATPINCYSTNEYFMSDIPNPTLAANKFQCANYNGNTTLIGYYYTNHGPDDYVVQSCNDITINQNYYLSIGQCCNNYAGGNLFPFEYRNWAHIKTFTKIVPDGYNFVSAQFNQLRTSGTLVTTTNPTPPAWQSITPVNPNSDTLVFNVEQYFQGYGGTIPLSDDGFHGTLQVILQPSCEVTPTIAQPIKDSWLFAPTSYLTGTGSASTTVTVNQDSITYEAPHLFLQSTLPSINAPDSLVTWEVSISNLSNNSNAINTWLGIPEISGISIVEVFDVENNMSITPAGEIFQVGTVNATGVRNFKIKANFTSCLKDSIIVYSGWNCSDGYPTTVQTYPCNPKSIKLSLTPLMPALVVNVTAPSSTIELCDTAGYIVEGVNVQLGTAYQVTLTAILPAGVSIVPGSSQMSYPLTNPYVSIGDPVLVSGTTWRWNVSLADTTIGKDGLKGIIQNTLNKFKIIFNVTTNCGYTSGSTIAFNLQGIAACGMQTGQEVALSSQLGITGATPPYTTAIKLATTYISPCADNSVMNVSVKNLGPLSFSVTDSIYLQLPPGVTFVNGSFVGAHNPPLSGIPNQYNLNNSQYLGWKLPVGVAAGDSSVFAFSYSGNPSLLSCDISQFEARTTSSTNVLCTQSGTNCGINIATGDTALSVFTYKAYLSLSNASATSIVNAPSGETVTVNIDITNTGEAISSGANSILQFYYDANADGVYSSNDVFITQDTLVITNNSTLHYSQTFNVQAGNACAIIAAIQSASNPCVCNPSQILINPKLNLMGVDSVLCHGNTLTIGSLPVTGYSYSWLPVTGLSAANISNPILTASNNTTLPVVTSYTVTVSRMGCTARDTISITVNPLPISDAGTTINTCAYTGFDTIGTSTTIGYTYSWSPSNGLSDVTIANPLVDMGDADTTLYFVTTGALGCNSTDSVFVTINPLPTATISGSTVVCKDAAPPLILFTGAGATPPYTFVYTVNNDTNQVTTVNDNDTVSVIVPTTTTDTIVYALIEVKESSSLQCFQLQNSVATVVIKPLPTAIIAGDTSVCQYSNTPSITFIGANGTPPYTFNYRINNGTPLSVVSTNGDTATVWAPTTVAGSYIYELLSVEDAEPISCTQIQNGIATVIVNPLPTATITGTVDVCKNDAEPIITFVASGGTPPYTVLYSINSVAQIPLVTIGDTATITVPTAVAGVYTYALISVMDSSITTCVNMQSASAIVTVKELPTATITASAVELCMNASSPMITFTGENGVSPYTFLYQIDSGSIQTAISSNGTNVVGLSVPTNSVDTLVYKLITVSESSASACAQSVLDSIQLIINPLPVANFNATEICLFDTVVFTNTSTLSLGNIISWTWSFGDDNGTSLIQNPSYIYNSAGIFATTLVVNSDNGCVDTIVKNAIVHPLPLPAFNTTNVCNGDSMFFNGQSTIPFMDVIQDWNWDFGDGNTSNQQYPSHMYANAGIYNVQLTNVSSFGCIDSIANNSEVYHLPYVAFATSDSIGCEPLCVTFQDLSLIPVGSNTQSSWSVGDGTPVSSSSELYHCYEAIDSTLANNYDVTLIVTSNNGCVSTLTKSNLITVYPKPEAAFIVTPSVTTIIDPIVQVLDNSVGATTWSWAFGNGVLSSVNNPAPIVYSDTGHYIINLTVTNQYGCVDIADGLVVVEPDFAFYVPNAFTPNDDGINDNFSGKGVFIEEYEMLIFDRWGELVYKTNDIDKPWDGRVNGGSEMSKSDVYVYKITVTDFKSNRHKYRGTVTLVQ